MRIFLFFKYYLFAIFKRLCRSLGIYFYYENRYGLKAISKYKSGKKDYSLYDRKMVNPLDLYMGVDGLIDAYSYCGKKCIESPHYSLIVSCEGGKIKNCEYILREQKGCLDSRDFIYRTYKTHMMHFNNAKYNMLNNLTAPIIVYSLKGKMYIYDGKHRAALYAYYNKLIEAIVIPAELIKSNFLHELNEKRKKNPNKYTRHDEILNNFFCICEKGE